MDAGRFGLSRHGSNARGVVGAGAPLPVLRKPGIKTVVTIHGLEYEFLPEYYQFPEKLWLNKSTEYAVKQADKLIAVSKWTKTAGGKIRADPGKISVVYEGVLDQDKDGPCHENI